MKIRVLLLCLAFCIFQVFPSHITAADRAIQRDPASASERRTALVIGNGDYQYSPLRNPANDARLMAQVLSRMGFEVVPRTNLNQNEMKRAIIDFGNRLARGGVGLFYYSGHGMQVNGRNYLIPVEAKIQYEEDVEVEAVDANMILAKMAGADNRLNIVILDACRNNPFASRFKSPSQGLAYMNAPSGTIVAYSTAPGTVASDGSGSYGLYTGALAEAMAQPGLRIEDVFKQTRVEVQKKSRGRQVPWESSSLTGNFFFQTGAGVRIETATLTLQDRKRQEEERRRLEEESKRLAEEKARLEEKQRQAALRQKMEEEKRRLAEAKKWLAQQPVPRPSGETLTNSIGQKFVLIPAGSFIMGSPSDESGRDADEGPQHLATLSRPFFMQTTEVTRDQWEAVMGVDYFNPRPISRPCFVTAAGANSVGAISGSGNLPIEGVSCYDAQEFIRRLNQKEGTDKYRLPTEAEWEYACRAGSTTAFAFGSCLSTEQGNYDGNYPLAGCNKGVYRKKAVMVGSLAPNAWGLYDMHGNVWEWCSDWFDAYPSGSVTDPAGPSSGSNRVYRGGSWSYDAGRCRSAYRGRFDPGSRGNDLGFRLARTK